MNNAVTASRLRLVFAFFILVLVAFLDIVTGPEISTSIFYLVPIIFITWHFGIGLSVTFVILSALLWLLSDTLGGTAYTHPAIPYWNATVRLGIFLIVAFDILKFKKEVERQKEANEKLNRQHAEITRLANVKSEFASMVSHELRTPLTAIKENLGIVADGSAGPLNDEQKDFLETAKRNVGRLARLLNDILDFQKLESGKMLFKFETMNLNGVVSEVANSFKLVAQNRGLALEVILDPGLPAAQIDRDRMGQVLINLVQNAIHYGGQGTVTIKTWHRGKNIYLSVQDQGKGIPVDEIPMLFESFRRLSTSRDKQKEGTGLGLAISRRIIRAHNGTITVDSEIGKGTCFLVQLHAA